jgi:hypothetical protein
MEAFRFVIHLLGDLHCPLHVEGAFRGGNDVPVTFEGQNASLHFVWDVSMPQKLTKSNESTEKAAAVDWAERLHKASNHVYEALGAGSALTSLDESSLSFAMETNQWVCKYVVKQGFEALKNKELSGNYYEGAVPIIENLLSKAGRRLAGRINLIAASESGGTHNWQRQEL